MWNHYQQNETMRDVYHRTEIIRKPISGIVSGYHELHYILIAPDDENSSHTIEVNGKINVSPKFIISASALQETFGEIFDPESFEKDIQGRMFSFAYGGKKNVKIESEYFKVRHLETPAREHLERIHDEVLMQENTRSGLIFNPDFRYYPVSLDRFISEIIEREFNV